MHMPKGPSRSLGSIAQDARVFRAGNSLAIRIPSAMAKSLALQEGSSVEITIDDGNIVIRKGISQDLQLLLDRITPDNVHDEQVRNSVGRERA